METGTRAPQASPQEVVEPKLTAANADQVMKAISDLQSAMETLHRKINFDVDQGSGRFHVKVIDTATDEVIREIPPEQVLKIAARMKELIGLLFDETV
ncbi:MAG TPA: flagellar protein FlaG, partial [bacterium]|nr:flagellar protein FlaG [bacterium]